MSNETLKDNVGENKEDVATTPYWYVVYTYSGYENKVKATLEKIVINRGLKNEIQQIIIPMEEEIEIKDGKQKTSIKKVFPGYVLVKMIMTDETWYAVRNIKGVFSFVGMGEKPTPLTETEMESLGISETIVNIDYEVGDAVTIVTEPFCNYPATIVTIDKSNKRVTVKVTMFKRDTSVELGFDQIQKI